MEWTLQHIDVLILCGGKGTRLKEIMTDRPKSMVAIGDRPFLYILMEYFRRYGFRRFILCTGYMGQMIQSYAHTLYDDIEVVISHENHPLGTGGALKNAEALIHSDPFLVINGDSFCPVNLGDFWNFHMTRDAVMSMVVCESDDPEDYGSVFIDENQHILGFEEKQFAARHGLINAGTYLFWKKILKYIPANKKYSLEYDVFPQLVHLKNNCYGYIGHSHIVDIGTPNRLAQAQAYFSGTASPLYP